METGLSRVVLVSRKFDYENDLALRRLCTLAIPEQSDPWEQIKLHAWDEERVEFFVGKERYARMLPAMKRILRTPVTYTSGSSWRMHEKIMRLLLRLT